MKLLFALFLFWFSFLGFAQKSPFLAPLVAKVCNIHLTNNDLLVKYPILSKESDINYQKALWARFKIDETHGAKMEKELLSLLENSPILNMIPIPQGISKPKLILLEMETLGILKKAAGNNFIKAESEIAAYKIDRLLGFNLVPLTTTRKIGDEKYSIQLFIRDAYTGEEIEGKAIKKALSIKGKDQFKKMRIFDYLIGNHDRSDDYLALGRKKVAAIDNGDAFKDREHQDFILSKFNLSFFLTKEGDELLKSLKRFDNEVYYQTLKGLVDDEIIDLFIERKEFLVYQVESFLRKNQ